LIGARDVKLLQLLDEIGCGSPRERYGENLVGRHALLKETGHAAHDRKRLACAGSGNDA
jgi:hypothetical protein